MPAGVSFSEREGHYNGRVWTFAKGGPNLGESPEQTALREVLEKTGGLRSAGYTVTSGH